MTKGKYPREVLFRVGDREIVRNGLYCIIGPCAMSSREMAVSYDPATNKSLWVQPNRMTIGSDGEGLMATLIDVNLFEDAFSTPKPYLRFVGGEIEFDHEYKPTPEHWKILTHWYAELDRAGIGGSAPDLTREEVREEFRREYGFT